MICEKWLSQAEEVSAFLSFMRLPLVKQSVERLKYLSQSMYIHTNTEELAGRMQRMLQ